MELTFQNDGSNSNTSKCALALLHMNGIVTPAWRLISQLVIAALNSTSQRNFTVESMVAMWIIGKSLIATAGML